MSRRLAACAVLAAVTCLSAGCHNQLKNDFAAFDRAYIPALALTREGQAEAARQAMTPLMRQWLYLRAEHADDRKAEHWQEGFNEAGRRITRAERLLNEGRLAEAHESLEGVRRVLMEARAGCHIDYSLDHLHRFHEPMEQITAPVRGSGPADLTEDGISQIRAALPRAKEIWKEVEDASFNAARYRFSAEDVGRMYNLIQAEKLALETLDLALEGGEPAEIAQAARNVSPPYMELYLMFGDFPGSTGRLVPLAAPSHPAAQPAGTDGVLPVEPEPSPEPLEPAEIEGGGENPQA